MKLGDAFDEIVKGEMIRKLEWEDERVFVTLADERLMISKPETKTLDYWIISLGDITADDWVIFKSKKMEMT